MSPSFSTLAIILKRRSVGELDRLVTLFTETHGKLTAKARGVRSATSKRSAHLELFNTVKVQLIIGRGTLIIAQTDLVTDRSPTGQGLKLLRIAYHLVETVDRLTSVGQALPEVFDLLNRALSTINHQIWEDEDRLVTAFEVKLLTILGFGLPVNTPGEIHEYIEELANSKLRSRQILNS